MDWNLIDEMIEARMISRVWHPDLPGVCLLDYTDRATYSRTWNAATLACRGLVVDWPSKTILARPFGKFFNLSEHAREGMRPVPHHLPFVVREKVDGSLGIIAHYGGRWRVSTRGSFVSEQAVEAQRMLDDVADLLPADKGVTYCVEIVYPANRIVVDYGGRRELVWLSSIRTSSGDESNACPSCFRRVRDVHVNAIADLPVDEPNAEGYVIRFADGTRVKVKLAEYVRRHKAMSDWSPKRAWELLSAGSDPAETIALLPDEMHDEARATVSGLRDRHAAVMAGASTVVQECAGLSRKDAAAQIMRSEAAATVCFALLDGQHQRAVGAAWRCVQP